MGMMDADRKARMFVTDVRNTDTPVLFKHSAVWSLKTRGGDIDDLLKCLARVCVLRTHLSDIYVQRT